MTERMPWDDMLDEMIDMAGDSAPPPQPEPKPHLIVKQWPKAPASWKGIKLGHELRLNRPGKGDGGSCYLRALGVVDSVVQWPDGREYNIPTTTLYSNYEPV